MCTQVLVLDSDATHSAWLVECLERGGYKGARVASLEQARRAVEEQSFDVLLLESILPDGDGRKLCDELRERKGDQMVIIFVSSDDTTARRIASLQVGADDFVRKPCDGDELLARIDAHCRRRGLRQLSNTHFTPVAHGLRTIRNTVDTTSDPGGLSQ